MTNLTGESFRNETFRAQPYAEQLALWSIRMWVRAYRSQDPEFFEALNQGLLLSDIQQDGVHALDAMMTILAVSTEASIDVRCPGCEKISLDEQRMLASMATLQKAQRDGTIGLPDPYLSVWLPRSALRMIRPPLSDFVQAFTSLELIIRPRPWILHLPIAGEPISSIHNPENRTLH